MPDEKQNLIDSALVEGVKSVRVHRMKSSDRAEKHSYGIRHKAQAKKAEKIRLRKPETKRHMKRVAVLKSRIPVKKGRRRSFESVTRLYGALELILSEATAE